MAKTQMKFEKRPGASQPRGRLWNNFGSRCFRAFLFVACGIFLVLVIRIVVIQQPQHLSNMPSSAIVVLGGGVTADGQVPIHTKLRVDKAIELYHQLGKDARIFPLSGGTPHKPNPVDSRGFPVWEACAASKALIKAGIPPSAIFEEAFSLDTVGNAYFLRTLHIHPGRYRDLYIITNDWHMPRTQSIFTTIFALPDTDPRYSHTPQPFLYNMLAWFGFADSQESILLHFVPVDSGVDDLTVLAARKEREMASLQSFREHVAPLWNNLYDLHEWMFTQHGAYKAQRHIDNEQQQRPNMSEEALKTY